MSTELSHAFTDVSAPQQLIPFRRFILRRETMGGLSSELAGMGLQLATGQCFLLSGVDEQLSGFGAFSSLEALERRNQRASEPGVTLKVSWIDEVFTTGGQLPPPTNILNFPT
jgi:hypothetical protein